MYTQRVQRRHRASRSGAEADDSGPQPATVGARRTDDRHGMQHRAVASDLVVLMEDMQFERAVATPQVHRLERDKRLSTVDGVLSQLLVLHAVRPAPQHLAAAKLGQIEGVGL